MSKTKLMLQALKKIPVFQSLPPSQVRQLITAAETRQLVESDVLCQHDTPSDEMYILLRGDLAVITAEGLRVATIRPITSVGEMGVITGQPRSATVSAVTDCRVLAIQRGQFEALFNDSPSLRARMLRNFIQILADRVTDDNMRMRDYELSLRRMEGRAAGVEQRILRNEARVDWLIEQMQNAGADAEGIRADIESRLEKQAATVLVVDDEEGFRQLVRETLGGLSVVEAADGAQALSTLETLDPDLVITDIRMPGVGGIELVDRIASLYPELPVVGVSGHVDRSEVGDSRFTAFVDKPLQVQDFRQLIERTLAAAAA